MTNSSPPPGSRIDLVESSDSRVVMTIPPGGRRARSLGCFAVLWNVITIPAGIAFVWATASGDVEWEGGDRPPLWGVIAFFAVFQGVGFTVLYIALKMKFESLMLCLEPGRLSIQRNFLGRKKLTLLPLHENSMATLRESYSENDVPVYRVEVNGQGREEKFGTALGLVEKQWLALMINRFLGQEDAPHNPAFPVDKFCCPCGGQLLVAKDGHVCPDCGVVYSADELADDGSFLGESLTTHGQAVADLAPEDLPPTSFLSVRENSPERLVVSFPLNPSHPIRFVVGGFCLIVAVLWIGFAVFMFVDSLNEKAPAAFDVSFAIFTFVLGCGGLAPLSIGLAVISGRARVTAARDEVSVRFHVGPFGLTRRVDTQTVQDVLLGRHSFVRDSGAPRSPLELRIVAVETTAAPLMLTMGSRADLSEQLCGLVRYQMHRMDCRLVSD